MFPFYVPLPYSLSCSMQQRANEQTKRATKGAKHLWIGSFKKWNQLMLKCSNVCAMQKKETAAATEERIKMRNVQSNLIFTSSSFYFLRCFLLNFLWFFGMFFFSTKLVELFDESFSHVYIFRKEISCTYAFIIWLLPLPRYIWLNKVFFSFNLSTIRNIGIFFIQLSHTHTQANTVIGR